MAVNTDPNYSTNITSPDLHRIDREWCIGDSLVAINNNTVKIDTRLENLEVKFPLTSTSLGNNSVTDDKIRDSVGLSVIGRAAQTTGNPGDIVASTDGAVLRRSGSSLGFGQIGSAGIANNAVNSDKILGSAVITTKINNLAVTTDKIANNAVTGDKILNGTITNDELADNTITGAKILNGTITNVEIANNAAIAGTKISPNFGGQNIITTGDLSIGTGTNYGGFYQLNRTVTFRGPNTTQPGPPLELDGYPGSNTGAKTIASIIHTTGSDSGGLLIIVGDNNGDESAIDVWNRGTGGEGATVSKGLKFRVDSEGTVTSSFLAGTGNRDLRVNSNGTLTTSTSDARHKKNVTPVTNALEKVNNLTGVYYNWIDEEKNSKDKCIGLIAQDVEKIVPELVFQNENGVYGVNYSQIGPLLINAVKELEKNKNQEINELKARIAALEAKLS